MSQMATDQSRGESSPTSPVQLLGEYPEPLNTHAPSVQDAADPGSSNTFEDLLADVERSIPDSGQLMLFTGEQFRLSLTLLRHKENPRVIWGLKYHEDWAFKATLLRFARGSQPVHLILSSKKSGAYEIRGWVVRRTIDTFWASPLPPEHTQQFWKRCLALVSHESEGLA